MNSLRPSVAQFLFHRAACKRQPPLVEENAKPVRSGNPEHHRRRVGQIAEALFTLTLRRFSSQGLEFSDIRAQTGEAG